MWRLRRNYGEKHYREFWSQLIYRLGMSHAMGNEKRFVVKLDRATYRVEDKALLTVEAYDENYEPLTDAKLPNHGLQAEWSSSSSLDSGLTDRALSIPILRPGMFETQLPLMQAGDYSIRVKDPITNKSEELRFEVTGVSAERLRGVRDLALQQRLAQETRGKSYDLTTVKQLVRDLQVQPKIETHTRNFPLWATPWWFGSVVALMLGEWFTRKMLKLT
jgi:hypothetical protein